jgi:glycosyl transferase, family 25
MQPATFVISLKDRVDRRREMTKQLFRVGWDANFFDAIRPPDADGFPSVGARGCFHSHLTVLEIARDAALPCVVILEDDVNFIKDFPALWKQGLSEISQLKWSIFYPGHLLPLRALGMSLLEPSTGVQCAHFMMINGSAVADLIEGLRKILLRPPGHPQGGPMHVDGAYSTIRSQNVHLLTYAFSPALGYQRPSRTDIGKLKWFDRARAIAPAVKVGRRLSTFINAR